MKSLFELLVDEIDAAIVDVTLSKIPQGEKAKKLWMLIQARDYQLQVAGIMDGIYPPTESMCKISGPNVTGIHGDNEIIAKLCVTSCPHRQECEGGYLKRLRIEGRIIRALDELPEETVEEEAPLPCCGDCRSCGGGEPKKIDPRKTWMI